MRQNSSDISKSSPPFVTAHPALPVDYARDSRMAAARPAPLAGGETVTQSQFVRRSVEQLRAINDATSDMIAVFNADGRLLDVNDRAISLLGYSREEMRALPLNKLFGPGYSEARARTKLVGAMLVGALDFEWELRRRNGELVPVEIRLRPVGRKGNGDDPAVIAIVRDVTRRRRIDEVLAMLARGSNQQSVDAFVGECARRLASVCGARYALVGRMDAANPGRVRTMAVWGGNRFLDNFSFDIEGTPCADAANTQSRKVARHACRQFPHDPMLREMEVDGYFGMPLLDSSGARIGVVSVMSVQPMQLELWVYPLLEVVIARIATELERIDALQKLTEAHESLERRVRQRTAELEAVNRELEAFTYSVSHDLRAPLRTVAGFSQALDEDFGTSLDPTAYGYLAKVRRSALRMGELIDGLLRLSRISSSELRFEPVDLSALVQDAVRQLRDTDPGRVVEVSIQPHLVARGDPALLRIVIENLIGNAWKYTSKRSDARIEFTSVLYSRGIAFRVADNGVGFDMQYAGKLFGAFQRLHSTAAFEGMGIGLATVQRIVHRHGGRVWADSEPDLGANFYFWLGDVPSVRDVQISGGTEKQ